VSTSSQSGSGKSLQVVYAACHIWNIAADAAKRATDVKAANPGACTSDSVSAIIVAATATEAFINELSHMLSTLDTFGRHAPPTTPVDWKGIGELLEQLEDTHAQVTAKYLLASILLPKDALRKGDQPYQDFDMLINVRNDFAHPKAQVRPPKYFDTFVNRGWTYNAKTDEVKLAGWMLQLETPEVARWACRAAHNIIWDIVERFDGPSEPLIQFLYEHLKFQWSKTVNDERVR
jgi:hypothetical protein